MLKDNGRNLIWNANRQLYIRMVKEIRACTATSCIWTPSCWDVINNQNKISEYTETESRNDSDLDEWETV